MTKYSPKAIVGTFSSSLSNALNYHDELLIAVHLKKHQNSLETILAEQFVFNITVRWEVFLNDLIISYLAKSPNTFSRSFRERILKSIKDKYGNSAAGITKINLPKKFSVSMAHSLVDPDDFNITISSSGQLTTHANNFLTARYAKLFTFNQDDAQFLDFIICMRNYLGHRSGSARKKLKTIIGSLSGSNAPFSGSARNIGVYLKTKNSSDETRAVLIGKRLFAIAQALK